jgi:hypothetical protein
MPAPYVTGEEPDLNQTLETAKVLDRHLAGAIKEFAPPKGPAMKGLRRLKNLSETLMASLDAEAEKVADELQKKHDDAVDATRKIRDHIGGEFKAAADEVTDMLNQITNGEPND